MTLCSRSTTLQTVAHHLLRYSLLSAAAAIVASGCVISHRVPDPVPFGSVAPKNFCPGDRIVASYDLSFGERCDPAQPDVCAANTPTIGIGIAPTSRPPLPPITGFVGRAEFEPEADEVGVTFSTGTAGGSRVFSFPVSSSPPRWAGRFVRDTTIAARRIVGDYTAPTLNHDAMCVGGTVAYSPGIVPGLPEFSPNLRIRSICNRSAETIQLILTSPSGDTVMPVLAAGTCFPLGPPVTPSGFDRIGRYEVRSASPRLCSPTQAPDLSPLRTDIVLACGN